MYQVQWVPQADILALAKKRGWEGGEGVLDYADEADCTACKDAKTFAAAITIAKAKLECDFFGQVRIERLVKVRCRATGDRWDADAVWHISDPTDAPSEDAPEYRPEVYLSEGEQIVA